MEFPFDPNAATWYAQLSMNPNHTPPVATWPSWGAPVRVESEPELLRMTSWLTWLLYDAK